VPKKAVKIEKATSKKSVAKKAIEPVKKERKAIVPQIINRSYAKKYVKESSDMSVSAEAISFLSEVVESLCDKAAERAKENNRKTILKQDI
jgi:histone H3/H4